MVGGLGAVAKSLERGKAAGLPPGAWFRVVSVPEEYGPGMSCWVGIWLRVEDPAPDQHERDYIPTVNVLTGSVRAIPSQAETETLAVGSWYRIGGDGVSPSEGSLN